MTYMNLYFAPLEGITTYTYRNAHAELFGGCDLYFAPFLVPTEEERLSRKTLRPILTENNVPPIVPQILCNNDVAFLNFSEKIKELGYQEVNLNFGCPSGTVVKKRRGAGVIKEAEFLNSFLDKIFSVANIKISVKTRAGFYSHEEFDRLLEIYRQYPIKELIIHPRVREEFYSGIPNMETFKKAYGNKTIPVCYNGNLVTASECENIMENYPSLHSIMIGRGAVQNPAIFREIKKGKPLATEELIAFSDLLETRYLHVLQSEVYTLHKLKEIWLYMMRNFPEEKKIMKAVKKSNRLSDLRGAISCLPEL